MNTGQPVQDTASAGTQPSEHAMTLWDGTELFYRAWLPRQPAGRALLLFHRGHEHSGRFQDVVEALDLKDVAMFAWDARGHGRSPGERGYAPSFAHLVKDLDCFVGHIARTYRLRLQDMVVMAPSVGAVTVVAWVHDYAPPIRAMVLAAPAFRVKLYVPLAIPGLRLLQRFKRGRKTFVKSYVKAKMLTHDPEQARRYNGDPLIARAIAVNILLDLHDAATRLIDDAGAIRVPTLMMTGGSDWVVKNRDQRRFFERLGSPIKRMRAFEGMYHDLLHEKNRHLVLDEARRFIVEAFERKEAPPPLLDAHRRGYTKDEYDRLCRPLPPLSPRRLCFAAQKLGMTTLGRLSRGIRLGFQTGFDSGQTLDYVYQNRPQGSLLLGKWFDRAYLNSIGWKGIRQRKANLEKLLGEAIRRLGTSGRPVRLLDIAAGPGRYLLETIRAIPDLEISALLRDNVPANLEAGRKLAEGLGLTGVRFEQGDAFDRESLAAIDPPPNVAVVSGLYELIGDNDKVAASLQGLAQAMREGGYLVYTGQPWHPQIEMIARVLINRDGDPWIMRRRTQEELDELVRAAGFEKTDMEIDRYGIFTVSLAKIGESLPSESGSFLPREPQQQEDRPNPEHQP